MDLKNIDLDLNEIANNCFCFNLRSTTRTITRLYDKELAPSGLKITQFSILVAIYLFKKATIGEIAKQQSLERTTLTRNLTIMERNGIVTITEDKDARKKIVKLTKKGEAVVQKAIPLWKTVQRKMREQLDDFDCANKLQQAVKKLKI